MNYMKFLFAVVISHTDNKQYIQESVTIICEYIPE